MNAETNGGPPPDPPRRAALLAIKLRAMVRTGWAMRGEDSSGGDGLVAEPLPLGAALRRDDGQRGWVLADLDGDPGRALGGALAWALSRGVRELHLLVPATAEVLARRAAEFALPITVWQVDDATLDRVRPADSEPEPPLPPAVAAAVDTLRAAGLEPVAEHGALHGELLGLEVARVEPDGSGGARRRVGVGRYEQELYEAQHGGEPPDRALAEVIATVRAMRRAGAPPHPANQLATERWLRSVLLANPGLVGATTLEPVAPPIPRAGVRERVPAFALGEVAGHPVLVACSTGVDLDLVPAAADARRAVADGLTGELASGPDGASVGLLLAVPEGDDHPVTRRLAAALRDPATVVTVPRGWRELTG